MNGNEKNAPRRWIGEEDDLLVQFLVEMNTDGKWKAEGGFKSGYLTHLEKLFGEKMPEARLRATNIDSRLSYLKKRFNALLEIKHKGSGFGWDDNLKMVTGDRSLFDDWAKSHKEAKGLYRKPFPLFDNLEEIFAKDRATGLKSALPFDRDDQESVQETPQEATSIKPNEVEVSTEVSNEVSTEVSGTSKRSIDEGSSKQPTKKKLRTTNKEIQIVQKNLELMMGKMLENSNSQIDKLVSVLEGPKNVKIGLREELGKVPGISRVNALSLCVKMTEDEIVIFRDLTDDDEKYDFLSMILEKS
ncbi:hypothetical protein SOVF_076180 [Spinacia oleracea]|uniref:Myb/SANT-like domain-containing protein n=1 Tax=Spinacia oleracea TaxID=3562 RepID=A0ABM3R4L9_SPIOL|nr:uncharacterized protein LOC130465720 [Spinacia oleracea]KNA17743.1 hypothetical protein SOVF_076180 [Spinacia oleracea]